MSSSSPRPRRRLHGHVAGCALLLGLALVVPVGSAGAAGTVATAAAAGSTAPAAADDRRDRRPVVTMTDLGILGEGARATRISDRGVVIGNYQVGTPGGGGTQRSFRWQDGVMSDLVDLGGHHGGEVHAGTTVFAINDRGQIAGISDGDDGHVVAVRWEPDGTIVRLGPPDFFSIAWDINRRGTVAGATRAPAGELRAVIWRDGTMTDLGDLGGGWSYATAINDAGEVTGASGDASGGAQAFLWRDGTMVGLPAPASVPVGAQTIGWDVNRRGDVMYRATNRFLEHLPVDRQFGLLSDGTDVTRLPGIGGPGVRPEDLNDRGQVVGAAQTADGAVHAFLAEDGTATDLGTLGGRDSGALAVNRRGQVVGFSRIPDDPSQSRATLWDDGTIVDLGAIGRASQAVDINRRGQIAGWSLDANRPECSDTRPVCGEHAMLWTVER